MTKEMMKIFPTLNDEAHIMCPSCGHVEKKKASDYRRSDGIVTDYECKCGYSFQIFTECRKYSRIESEYWGSCKTADNKETEIKIINISINGVGFIMTDSIGVSVGERLQISFIFKDKKRELVSKKAIVRRKAKSFIGAEFETNIDESDGELASILKT